MEIYPQKINGYPLLSYLNFKIWPKIIIVLNYNRSNILSDIEQNICILYTLQATHGNKKKKKKELNKLHTYTLPTPM